ncbi:uncharacterized protein LOC144650984 [Oculina patagonica]
MILTKQQLLLVTICLVLNAIICCAGYPPGLEIKTLEFCGPRDETAKINISPWPFIRSGERVNVSVTFTPAEDVFAATFQYKVISVSDGQVVARGRDNACRQLPDLCSLPAGETHVWRYSDVMRAFPPGFKMTFKAVLQLYNEEHFMFLCFEAVATLH